MRRSPKAYPGCINHNFLWNVNYADLNCVIEKGQQDLLTLNSSLSFKFRRTSLVALMWQCHKMSIQSLLSAFWHIDLYILDLVFWHSLNLVPSCGLKLSPNYSTYTSYTSDFKWFNAQQLILNKPLIFNPLYYHKVSSCAPVDLRCCKTSLQNNLFPNGSRWWAKFYYRG